MDRMLDITAPDHEVEVRFNHDHTIVWVNVDGRCALRVCQIPKLVVLDDQEPIKE